MDLVMQGLVGAMSVMVLGLGATSMFAPKAMIGNFAIEPQGRAGLNTIRGVIGGLFIACLGMLAAGLVTGETLWFLAVAAVFGVIALGRVVGLLFDGLDRTVIPPLLLELVFTGILVGAHAQLGA
ncbi:MAG: DUF4345 family protein [Myxococcota bacterium]